MPSRIVNCGNAPASERKLVLISWIGPASVRMQGGYHPIQAIASGIMLDPTLDHRFARRFATYKRADLVFHNRTACWNLSTAPTILCKLSFAGKAHPATNPASC